MNPKGESCASCVCFSPAIDKTPAVCRRYPARTFLVPVPKVDLATSRPAVIVEQHVLFPVTTPENWCGEYIDKSAEEEARTLLGKTDK